MSRLIWVCGPCTNISSDYTSSVRQTNYKWSERWHEMNEWVRIWNEMKWRRLKVGNVCMCVLMPTHCTITCFRFCAMRIDDVMWSFFSIHAPLRQTTLHGGCVAVFVYWKKWGYGDCLWNCFCSVCCIWDDGDEGKGEGETGYRYIAYSCW